MDSKTTAAPPKVSISPPPESQESASSKSTQPKKKTRDDFTFVKTIGEGSYSTVYLAREKSTGKEYAIKVLEKRHIIREKKVPYVSREKEVLAMTNHPFIVRLFFTFQDKENLYYGLSYAKRGSLLPYINKLGSFDEKCTQFYSAEIIHSLEYMHGLGIIHRDLKPENILFSESMHIQITDFGTAKILGKDQKDPKGQKTSSFVGTAQYVSPELLTDKVAFKSSDLWALGCIVYQLLSGRPPFRAGNEYQIFQKIVKLEYDFPDGFPDSPRDLVQKLLILEPKQRLGCHEMGGFEPLKGHHFYEGVDWETLHLQTPPRLLPYLPATSADTEGLRSNYDVTISGDEDSEVGEDEPFQDSFLARFGLTESRSMNSISKESSSWQKFCGDHQILMTGLVDKRKGFFSKRRQLILTEGPHLYYVDPQAMVLKGEIPWTKDLRPEAKSFKIFFVHTPSRTYYLEDPEGYAVTWVRKIQEVHDRYYK